MFGSAPPAIIAEVVPVPDSAPLDLPVPKSPTSVHVDPFHASVLPVGTDEAYMEPPNNNASVCVPQDPAPSLLPIVFDDSVNVVHADPFQDSVSFEADPIFASGPPLNASAAV